MKERSEFSSNQAYAEYLRVYFIGQAITSLACMELTRDINYDKLSGVAIKIADSLIEKLGLI